MEYEEFFNEVDECLRHQFSSTNFLGIALKMQLQGEMNKVFDGMTDDMKIATAQVLKEICEDVIFDVSVKRKAKGGKNENA